MWGGGGWGGGGGGGGEVETEWVPIVGSYLERGGGELVDWL